MWRRYGTKARGKDDLTPRQLMLSARVRELLTAERVRFEEGIQLNGEAVYVFTIATFSETQLTVRIIVVDDVFQFEANGALLMRDLARQDDRDWVEECSWVLGLLLQSDLRIRECRTIFGGTARGIWLSTGENEGAWNGEWPAVRRRECPEQVFSNWYQRSDSP
jgi:hypothetical protein